MKDIQKIWGFYKDWRITANATTKTRNITNAANLTFNAIDFVSGKFTGGPYINALTNAGRKLIAEANHRNGIIRHTDIIANPDSFMNAGGQKMYHYALDPSWYAFSRAWFASAYNSSWGVREERLAFIDIHEYIAAIITLRNAGLLHNEQPTRL
jgi:hypothetical protein